MTQPAFPAMKLRSLLLFSILCSGLSMLAQSANFNGFTYQAVVRDANGDPVPSQAVGLQAVIQVGPSDTYVETHAHVAHKLLRGAKEHRAQHTCRHHPLPYAMTDGSHCGKIPRFPEWPDETPEPDPDQM